MCEVSEPVPSFLKVAYDLRPAKQVERRMLIETFQALSHIGFPISTFQYTGLGSVYFVDFILFHKVLGINRLLSIEANTRAKKRVRFNQPFRCVKVRIGKIGDYIPTLSRQNGHILWLDYDSILRRYHLEDIWVASAHLPRQSILLVTVDVEPPDEVGPKSWREYFVNEVGDYAGSDTQVSDYHRSKLIERNRDFLIRAIQSGVAARDLEYIPLFCFSYADGHEMLTVGGMLGTAEDADSIRKSLRDLWYLRFNAGAKPVRITVPPLTRKERMYLDQSMPAKSGWKLRDFELPAGYLAAYKRVYRYLPTYAELTY